MIIVTPKKRELPHESVDDLIEAARIAHKVLSDFLKAAPASKDVQTAFLMLDDALMTVSTD